MGHDTHKVPLELFALNRRRLVERLQTKKLGNVIVLLQGGDDKNFYDTDVVYVFRQVMLLHYNCYSNRIWFI